MSLVDLIERLDGGDDIMQLRQDAADAIIAPLKKYPQQVALARLFMTRSSICCTANRRAGKTAAIGRIIEARVLARDNYVVRVLSKRLGSPSMNWITASNGLVARWRDLGILKYAKIERQAGSITSIHLPWGSSITVHAVAHEVAVDEAHGFTADLFWVDEAQAVHLLPYVIATLVSPIMSDRPEESPVQLVLSGTPGREVGSYFHRASDGDGFAAVKLSAWSNPHFGDTHAKRWGRLLTQFYSQARHLYHLNDQDLETLAGLDQKTCDEIAQGNIPAHLAKWFAGLHPDFLRQGFGHWVASLDESVYAWPHVNYFGSVDGSPYPTDDSIPPVGLDLAERLNLLPVISHGEWRCAIGVDLGWSTSSTSIVVICWNTASRNLYVVWSEAANKEDDDTAYDRLAAVVTTMKGAGISIEGIRADVNGTRLGTGAAWSKRLRSKFGEAVGEWVQAPDKSDRHQQYELVNIRITDGELWVLQGDVIDTEGRHLRWRQYDANRPKEPEVHKFREVTLPDGTVCVPGDHALDAFRYAVQIVPELENIPAPVDLTREEAIEQRHVERRRKTFARLARNRKR